MIEPILRGLGDIRTPHVEDLAPRIGLVAGDLALSTFEDKLSDAWPRCHNRDEASFRAMTAFYRALLIAAEGRGADVVLIDVGPNLGAINRSALVASNFVAIPLASDLFSLQGLRNLGPQLRAWREAWRDLRPKCPDPALILPPGEMRPVGYVVMQHAVRSDRPAKAHSRWMERIPVEYRESVLENAENPFPAPPVAEDPYCLASLRHYRSLMPFAGEARKPMFFLRPADGAIGAHVFAVKDCYRDFDKLAARIGRECGLPQ